MPRGVPPSADRSSFYASVHHPFWQFRHLRRSASDPVVARDLSSSFTPVVRLLVRSRDSSVLCPSGRPRALGCDRLQFAMFATGSSRGAMAAADLEHLLDFSQARFGLTATDTHDAEQRPKVVRHPCG